MTRPSPTPRIQANNNNNNINTNTVHYIKMSSNNNGDRNSSRPRPPTLGLGSGNGPSRGGPSRSNRVSGQHREEAKRSSHEGNAPSLSSSSSSSSSAIRSHRRRLSGESAPIVPSSRSSTQRRQSITGEDKRSHDMTRRMSKSRTERHSHGEEDMHRPVVAAPYRSRGKKESVSVSLSRTGASVCSSRPHTFGRGREDDNDLDACNSPVVRAVVSPRHMSKHKQRIKQNHSPTNRLHRRVKPLERVDVKECKYSASTKYTPVEAPLGEGESGTPTTVSHRERKQNSKKISTVQQIAFSNLQKNKNGASSSTSVTRSPITLNGAPLDGSSLMRKRFQSGKGLSISRGLQLEADECQSPVAAGPRRLRRGGAGGGPSGAGERGERGEADKEKERSGSVPAVRKLNPSRKKMASHDRDDYDPSDERRLPLSPVNTRGVADSSTRTTSTSISRPRRLTPSSRMGNGIRRLSVRRDNDRERDGDDENTRRGSHSPFVSDEDLSPLTPVYNTAASRGSRRLR